MANLQKSPAEREYIDITLLDVLLFFKKNFLLFLASGFIFAVLGVCASFLFPKTFKARTILLPEYARMGDRGGFLSMSLGVNNKDGAENLFPELYGNVLNSRPFGLYLLDREVVDENARQYSSLRSYITRDTSTSFLTRLFAFKSKPSVTSSANDKVFSKLAVAKPTFKENMLIDLAKGIVTVNVGANDGLITIEAELTDPVVAAIIVESSKSYLIDYVESYRTAKLANNVKYLIEQVSDTRRRLNSAEYALQNYRDRNRNIGTNVARIEEQKLQSDFTMAQSLYLQLSSQLDQAKLKVKQEKPVFKELEPVTVPTQKSGPQRILFAVIASLLGTFATILAVIFHKEKLHLKIRNYGN
jgi:uncharacterized protein involved in exopolysaccharide biosynthesis